MRENSLSLVEMWIIAFMERYLLKYKCIYILTNHFHLEEFVPLKLSTQYTEESLQRFFSQYWMY